MCEFGILVKSTGIYFSRFPEKQKCGDCCVCLVCWGCEKCEENWEYRKYEERYEDIEA